MNKALEIIVQNIWNTESIANKHYLENLIIERVKACNHLETCLDTNTFKTNLQHIKDQLIKKYSSTLGKRSFQMILQSLNVATRKKIQKCLVEESLIDLFSVNNERRSIVFSYNFKSCWNERSDHVTIIN